MHLAMIPDGNRRWAKEKGLPKIKGHEEGAKKIFMVVDWFINRDDINELSIFLLSTENFKKREKKEIAHLEMLGIKVLKELKKKYKGKLNLNVGGKIEEVRPELRKAIKDAERELEEGKQLNLLLNYGGRTEIINAIKMMKGEIDEVRFKEYLWVKSDVDLVIRTGKETRISNFLLYQIAYAEIFFLDIYWPEITIQILENVIDVFKRKERRFGR